MNRRRRRGRPATPARPRPPLPDDEDFAVPGWRDLYGRRMFVVGFTPGGFPFGYFDEDAAGDRCPDAAGEPF